MTRTKALRKFNQKLIDLVSSINISMKNQETKFVYLDRNFFPLGGAILAVSQLIDRKIPWGIQYTKLYLNPLIINKTIPNFPLSYEFMAQNIYYAVKAQNENDANNPDK